MKITLALLLALGLAGCACGPQSQLVAVGPASQSTCAQAVEPQVAAYAIGPESYVRGTLAVPGEFVQCVGQFLQCSLDSLFPKPVPTPVFAGASMPMAAPMCAPAPQAFCAPEPQAACAESFVEEPYTVRVPVQTWREETRVRRYRVETIQRRIPLPECAPAPAPAAAPAAAPCDPPSSAPPSGSASDPFACCDPCTGCCGVPACP